MTEDVLTFEELRRAQHQERDMDTLQDLDDDFLDRAQNYLEMKRDPESHLENQEYRNAKHILEDLLDMRQKKVVRLAFLAHKSNVNAENLLPGEERLFENTREAIGSYRDNVHDDLFTNAAAEQTHPEDEADAEPEDSETGGASDGNEGAAENLEAEDETADAADDGTIRDDADNVEDADTRFSEGEEVGGGSADEEETDTIFGGEDTETEKTADMTDAGSDDYDDTGASDDADDSLSTVVMTQNVPEFMGVDLNAYGPFEAGEEAQVPEKNADVLVEQGKAERPG